jgi:hypothetical protein
MKPFTNSHKVAVFIILLCLSVFLVNCTALKPVLPPARCIPSFPDLDGWYGGDGAYSVALDKRRTLWVFGDTFVSHETGRKDRVGMDVVMGNTLAISTCPENGEFTIHYYLKNKDGEFIPFFGEGEVLWPQDPFIADDALYIPLLVIQGLPESQPPFNFKIAGHTIARIKDFTNDDPRLWTVEYLDWSNALASGIDALATTSVVHRGYVYFYPLYRHTDGNVRIAGNIAARISIRRLDNPAYALEYLHQDNTWQQHLHPDRVKIIFSAGLSELSVRYSEAIHKWRAVYLSPENKGRKLIYHTAEKPEGPWSEPAALIDSIAEVDPSSSLYHPGTFCYAGKEHLHFSDHHNLVITYVCNSSEAPDHKDSFLRNHLFLYRPVVKNVPAP